LRPVTRADWLALAFVAIAALLGLRKGLVGSALSLAGIAAGAILGSRIAPDLLSGGDDSPYTPVVALAGAAVGAIVFETIGTLVGHAVRRALWGLPPLRALDALGGLAVGAAAGLAVVWVLGAVALHLPGQTKLRHGAQRSLVLQRLNSFVPPDRLMDAIQRVDPFPSIAGPAAPVEPPDPRLLRRPGVRAAAPSVVRVVGVACGLSVSGSGWLAAPRLVVTAAHVVAGQDETTVETARARVQATAVAFDPRNDLAVLRLSRELGASPLRLGDADSGEAVVILGYPEGGPFTAVPGRIGRTTTVISDDAYGRGPVARTITSLAGRVRQGNSGGPAVNAQGEVETTVFAARIGSQGGFGVPPQLVREALEDAGPLVSTGDCAG
jgi:S1-C subfamily serine protease